MNAIISKPLALPPFFSLLQDVAAFIKSKSSEKFIKTFFRAESRNEAIESFHRQISACIDAFQISLHINLNDRQHRYEAAVEEDLKLLHEKLTEISTDYQVLWEMLSELTPCLDCPYHSPQLSQTSNSKI